VVLGAPACGKTTLLQKMRYWAALAAYEVLSMHVWWMWWCVCVSGQADRCHLAQEPDENHLPVFVALASYAAFVDTTINVPGRQIEGEDRLASASIMQYLQVICSEENYRMLCFYHARSQPTRGF
jgi:hypothetical protein